MTDDIENIAIVSQRNIVDFDIKWGQSISGYVSKMTGFRTLDLLILSAVVSSLCCPLCNQESFSLSKHLSMEKGLASALVIECSLYDYINEFHTSKRNTKAFEVNVRSV